MSYAYTCQISHITIPYPCTFLALKSPWAQMLYLFTFVFPWPTNLAHSTQWKTISWMKEYLLISVFSCQFCLTKSPSTRNNTILSNKQIRVHMQYIRSSWECNTVWNEKYGSCLKCTFLETFKIPIHYTFPCIYLQEHQQNTHAIFLVLAGAFRFLFISAKHLFLAWIILTLY